MIKWLYVLDLDQQHIARFCVLDVKWTGKIMHATQINILHVVGTVIVLDLTTGPIKALNLDRLAILDGSGRWNCASTSVFVGL